MGVGAEDVVRAAFLEEVWSELKWELQGGGGGASGKMEQHVKKHGGKRAHAWPVRGPAVLSGLTREG